MIQIKIKNTTVRLDFSFFAALALFGFSNGGSIGFAALAACALHEMSHLAMMTALSQTPDIITFYGAGIRITSAGVDKMPKLGRTFVLAAGSAGNFIFAFVLWITGHHAAALINVFTGAFNLLPIGELDGSAMLKAVVIRRCKPENVDKIMRLFGIISAAAGISFLVFFGGVSSPMLLFSILYIAVVSSWGS